MPSAPHPAEGEEEARRHGEVLVPEGLVRRGHLKQRFERAGARGGSCDSVALGQAQPEVTVPSKLLYLRTE